MREEHYASLEERKLLDLAKARLKAPRVDWAGIASPGAAVPWAPKTLGARPLSVPIAELLPFIDWNPFFATWELRGKYPNRGYPKIFDDADVGAEARKLHGDATAMLAEIVAGGWLEARGVAGIFPASAVGDDVEVYAPAADGARGAPSHKFCMLRQQAEKETEEPYLALSDFIAPKSSGIRDYIGAFAVAIHGGEAQYARFAAEHDDFKKIMLQALSDRLAEAFAEWAHLKMRKETWGYAADEALSPEDLLKCKYQGIRPAPGYPSRAWLRRPPPSPSSPLPFPPSPSHRLPSLPSPLLCRARPHGEENHVVASGRARRVRHPAHREPRNAARLLRERACVCGAAQRLLCRRPAAKGPSRGLRRAQGGAPGGNRAVAGPEPGVRARHVDEIESF